MSNVMRGMDLLLYAEVAEVATVIGGQRNATLNRSADELETTSKDSQGGWKTFLTGFKEWSVEGDGILVYDDEGFKALEDSFLNGETINVELKTPSGRTYKGLGIVSDLPIEAPYDDAATYSITIKGAGALEQTDQE